MMLRTALLLLAVLSLVLLLLVLIPGEPTDGDDEALMLLPGLAASRDAVNRVVVTGLDDEGEQLTIVRGDSGWSLPEKSGYSVDFESFVEFLDAVVEARLTEKKTSKESFHPRLGLAAGGGPGEAGMQVDIQAGDKEFTFIKGIESSAQTGTFIRYPDEDQVWLADKTFDVSVNPLDWINPVVINLDSDRVVRVEMIRGGKVQLAAARDGSSDEQHEGSFDKQHEGSSDEKRGELTLLNQPPDTELKYPTIVSGLARMLVNLRFEDVSRYDPTQWPDYGVARVQLDSGASIEARTRTREGKFLLHLPLDNHQDTKNYTDLKNWQFEISEYAFKQLNRTIHDMLKEDASD